MPIRPELRHFYRGPHWQATRLRIQKRASDRCEQCGRKNRSVILRWEKTVLIQCGCAHLNGVAGDDRDENLAWLCRGCHLQHDQGQHKETRATRKDSARPLLAATSPKENYA
jgi:hypothetical protein